MGSPLAHPQQIISHGTPAPSAAKVARVSVPNGPGSPKLGIHNLQGRDASSQSKEAVAYASILFDLEHRLENLTVPPAKKHPHAPDPRPSLGEEPAERDGGFRVTHRGSRDSSEASAAPD